MEGYRGGEQRRKAGDASWASRLTWAQRVISALGVTAVPPGHRSCRHHLQTIRQTLSSTIWLLSLIWLTPLCALSHCSKNCYLNSFILTLPPPCHKLFCGTDCVCVCVCWLTPENWEKGQWRSILRDFEKHCIPYTENGEFKTYSFSEIVSLVWSP